MRQDNYLEGFYKFSVFFVKLVYVNVLWILFVMLGFGLFGFFPSTISTFTIIRQWILGDSDIPVFKTFWLTYKKEFIKSNLLGVSYICIGIILVIDITYFSAPTNIVSLILFYFFWIVTIIYLLFGFFLPTVYVHYYQKKWWEYYRSTFMIMLLSPLTVLAFIVTILGAWTTLRIIPGLIPLFTCSGLAYVLMLLSYRVFNRIDLTTSDDKAGSSNVVNV